MAEHGRVALIEVLERDGRVRQQFDVRGWPVSIGRALECDLVLDDPHVAARHAVVAPGLDDRLWLEVGPTRNGLRGSRRLLRAGERAPLAELGRTWQLGHTRLRLRLPGDTLAPERPLAPAAHLAPTVLFSLLLWALLIAQHAVRLDPGAGLTAWLPVLLGPPLAMVLWCAGWALASKLFRQRFDFGPHWALAARWLFWILLGRTVLMQAAAALGSPTLFRLVGPAEAAAFTAMLYFHARLVLPQHAKGMAASFAAAFLAGTAVLVALNDQREQPWLGPLYMHALPHPDLRLSRTQPPERFVQGAAALRQRLDRRARAEPDEADTLDADDAAE